MKFDNNTCAIWFVKKAYESFLIIRPYFFGLFSLLPVSFNWCQLLHVLSAILSYISHNGLWNRLVSLVTTILIGTLILTGQDLFIIQESGLISVINCSWIFKIRSKKLEGQYLGFVECKFCISPILFGFFFMYILVLSNISISLILSTIFSLFHTMSCLTRLSNSIWVGSLFPIGNTGIWHHHHYWLFIGICRTWKWSDWDSKRLSNSFEFFLHLKLR